MPKFNPFDRLAKEFTQITDRLKECQDQRQRKDLLLAMRMIVDEADHLTKVSLAEYPDVSRENVPREV